MNDTIKSVGSSWHMIAAIFVSGPLATTRTLIHASIYKITRVIHLKTCFPRQYITDVVSDGWSTPIVKHKSASVYVQAWKFSPSDILFSRTDT